MFEQYITLWVIGFMSLAILLWKYVVAPLVLSSNLQKYQEALVTQEFLLIKYGEDYPVKWFFGGRTRLPSERVTYCFGSPSLVNLHGELLFAWDYSKKHGKIFIEGLARIPCGTTAEFAHRFSTLGAIVRWNRETLKDAEELGRAGIRQ